MTDVNRIGLVSLVAVLALGAAAAAGELRAGDRDTQALAAQARTIAQLQGEVDSLRAADPDWAAVVAQVQPSVVTIVAGDYLGSGWVARTDASGSYVVTNFHVIRASVEAGDTDFEVMQRDHTMAADVVRTDRLDDLALLHVSVKLKALVTAALRPKVGTAVLDLGSPLGLDGSVSVGVVAAYRSIFGSDYLQFTAAISPGNSGGPVVDSKGRVVGIATAKILDDNADSLGLAIPVQIACAELVDCAQA